MRLLIAGTRSKFPPDGPTPADLAREQAVRDYVAKLEAGTVVLSGGARGVDTVAVEAAKARGLPTLVLRAVWRDHRGDYNPDAGFDRNSVLVEKASHVVAFWDGRSGGTRDTIKKARDAGKLKEVILG